jgi:hypothetical protein
MMSCEEGTCGPRIGRPAVPPREERAALGRYPRAHPRVWSALRPVLEETLGARIDEEGTELPVVALELEEAGAD